MIYIDFRITFKVDISLCKTSEFIIYILDHLIYDIIITFLLLSFFVNINNKYSSSKNIFGRNTLKLKCSKSGVVQFDCHRPHERHYAVQPNFLVIFKNGLRFLERLSQLCLYIGSPIRDSFRHLSFHHRGRIPSVHF